MTFSLCAGILELASRNASEQNVRYAAQQSANGASFTYADIYMKELRACVVDEFSLRLDDESDELMQVCREEGLNECMEAELVGCEIDLTSCYEPDDSPIETCQEDPAIRQTALNAARSAARTIASKHKVEVDGEISITQNQVKLKMKKRYDSDSAEFKFQKEIVKNGESLMKVTTK